MSDIQSQIDSIIARSQAVVSDINAYKEQVDNIPEPDTDNISSDVVSMSITASDSYNISCGAASIAMSNTATTVDGLNISTLEERITTLEQDLATLQTTVGGHETRIAALEAAAP